MKWEFKIICDTVEEKQSLANMVAILSASLGHPAHGKTIDVDGAAGKPKALKAASAIDEGDDELPKKPSKKSAPTGYKKPVEEDDNGEPEIELEAPAEDEIELPKTKKKPAAAPAEDDGDDELPKTKRGPGRPPKAKAVEEDDEPEIEAPKTNGAAKPKYTQDDIIKAFQAKAKKDKDFCYKLLKKYDAINARAIDPKNYNAVMKDLAA
jgi:hypothetical protein